MRLRALTRAHAEGVYHRVRRNAPNDARLVEGVLPSNRITRCRRSSHKPGSRNVTASPHIFGQRRTIPFRKACTRKVPSLPYCHWSRRRCAVRTATAYNRQARPRVPSRSPRPRQNQPRVQSDPCTPFLPQFLQSRRTTSCSTALRTSKSDTISTGPSLRARRPGASLRGRARLPT